MPHISHDIFTQVASLNLPLGEYAVVGSGVMSVYGIRPHKDIDLLVTEELYHELQHSGWQVKQIRPDFEVVVFDVAEASPKMITLENYEPDTQKLLATADIINGIPFTSLAEVIEFKRALGREKDRKDIEMIEDFLKTYPNPLTFFEHQS